MQLLAVIFLVALNLLCGKDYLPLDMFPSPSNTFNLINFTYTAGRPWHRNIRGTRNVNRYVIRLVTNELNLMLSKRWLWKVLSSGIQCFVVCWTYSFLLQGINQHEAGRALLHACFKLLLACLIFNLKILVSSLLHWAIFQKITVFL
jgi:hypothetical protein